MENIVKLGLNNIKDSILVRNKSEMKPQVVGIKEQRLGENTSEFSEGRMGPARKFRLHSEKRSKRESDVKVGGFNLFESNDLRNSEVN